MTDDEKDTENSEITNQLKAEETAEETQTTTSTTEPPANFDWDLLGKKQQSYSEEERAKYEAMYEETMHKVGLHEILDGVIVAMNNREVVVNIGYKSDGIISLSEVKHNPDLKIGDTIEVYV